MNLIERILCLCIFFCHVFSNGQSAFKPNWDGYVPDTMFHHMIKSRSYNLVGAFDKSGRAKVMKQGLWGLIDLNGNELIPVLYTSIAYVVMDKYHSYYLLLEHGKWFFADSNGQKILREGYEQIEVVTCDPVLLIVKNGNASYLIDIQGSRVSMDYEKMELFQRKPLILKVKKENYYGLIDSTGKVLIPARYHEVNAYRNGYAAIRKFLTDGIVYRHKKKIIQLEYDDFKFEGRDNLAVIKVDNKFGLIDMNGKWILEPIYNNIEFKSFRAGDVFFVYSQSGSGMYRGDGKVLVPMLKGQHFEEIDWGEELIRISRSVNHGPDNKLYGIVNSNGEIVCPVNYHHINYPESPDDPLLVVSKAAKMGLIDRAGKVILEPVYDRIEVSYRDNPVMCQTDVILIQLNGKYGLVDKQGREMYPPVLSEVDECFHNRLIIRRQHEFGVINLYGKEILPIGYESIEYIENLQGFKIRLGGKYGVADTAGNVLIPCKYETIDYYANRFIVLSEGKTFTFDMLGKTIHTPAALPFNYELLSKNRWENIGKYKWGITDPSGRFLFHILNDVEVDSGNVDSTWLKFRCFLENDTSGGRLMIYKEEIFPEFHQSRFVTFRVNGKVGIVDTFWRTVVKPQFDEIRVEKGFFMVRSGKLWGLLDSTGHVSIPCAFDEMNNLGHGVFRILINKLYGLIRSDGTFLCEVKYDEIETGQTQNYWVRSADLWAMMDSAGREISLFKYGEPGYYRPDIQMFQVVFGGLRTPYGYKGYVTLLDRSGHEVFFRSMYTQLNFHPPLIVANIGNHNKDLWGLTDLHDRVIIPFENKNINIKHQAIIIQKTSHNYYLVKIHDTSDMAAFDYIGSFETDGFANAAKDGKTYLIDWYGSFSEILLR